jgi:ATP-dependent Lhr-like helicase
MVSVFSMLNPKIQDLLRSKNISEPTEPQTIAIPPILNGKNILLIAPTGLGKTESALLPIFHNFLELKKIWILKKKVKAFQFYILLP